MQNQYRIVNLVDPVDAQDGVTKSYLEGRIPELTGDDVELAKAWAIKMDGTVDGTDYSSKYHATEAKSDAVDAAASEVAAAGSAASAAASAAATAALWQDFDLRYLGAHPAPPTTGNPNPNDPDAERPPVEAGSLYFNTVDQNMYVYDGTQWIVASSAAIDTFDQFEWTATAGQTVFTTNKDMNPTMIQVYVNGVLLSRSDYTADKRTVTLVDPSNAGDLVQVNAFQEATILGGVITSQEVDYVKVLPFEAWPIADPDDRTLYVVLPEPGKDYGTLWLGSIQIGGAGGGGGLEGSPPAPINVSWESDDPAVSSFRKITWQDGGVGTAGSTIGYGVVPANEAAKSTTITQADNTTMHATVTGTEPDVVYKYQVFAANLAGPGEMADVPDREFPGPEAPTNLTSDADDAFALSWDHSGQSQIVEDGAVTEYTIRCTDPSVTVAADGVTKTGTIDGATVVRDKTYTFTVSATSGADGKDSGEGEESAEYQREFVPPGMPYNLEVNGTTLSWEIDPVDTGPPTEYLFTFEYPEISDGDPDNGIDPEPTDPDFTITWNGD